MCQSLLMISRVSLSLLLFRMVLPSPCPWCYPQHKGGGGGTGGEHTSPLVHGAPCSISLARPIPFPPLVLPAPCCRCAAGIRPGTFADGMVLSTTPRLWRGRRCWQMASWLILPWLWQNVNRFSKYPPILWCYWTHPSLTTHHHRPTAWRVSQRSRARSYGAIENRFVVLIESRKDDGANRMRKGDGAIST